MSVHVLGGWHTETGRMVRIGGQWRNVTSTAVHVGGAWRQAGNYAPAFSASAPDEADGYASTNKPTYTIVTTSATITPNGGIAPYSYQWTRQSGDNRISAGSPTMATTSFTASLRNEETQATFSWVCTDANGKTATGTILIDLQAESGFQGGAQQ